MQAADGQAGMPFMQYQQKLQPMQQLQAGATQRPAFQQARGALQGQKGWAPGGVQYVQQPGAGPIGVGMGTAGTGAVGVAAAGANQKPKKGFCLASAACSNAALQLTPPAPVTMVLATLAATVVLAVLAVVGVTAVVGWGRGLVM